MLRKLFHFVVALLLSGLAFAQQPDSYQDSTTQQTVPVERMNHTPVYRIKVVARTTKAVNYRHHSGKTKLDMRGTDLMPEAKGRATVESRTGRMEIYFDLDHVSPPTTFG